MRPVGWTSSSGIPTPTKPSGQQRRVEENSVLARLRLRHCHSETFRRADLRVEKVLREREAAVVGVAACAVANCGSVPKGAVLALPGPPGPNCRLCPAWQGVLGHSAVRS